MQSSKEAARETAAEKRLTLAAANPDAAIRLAHHAKGLITRLGAGVYAGYMPIRSELSPLLLLHELASLGAKIALPLTPSVGNPLTFHQWCEGDALTDGRYGTLEPEPASLILRPDVILVPLLAFDLGCWRLGYGGGYYDRTLADLRQCGGGVCAIGIAYEGQRLDKIPVDAHDMPLDMVLCPSGLVFPL
jgi:5-formyltetrahydrofolate cyclo-ligase